MRRKLRKKVIVDFGTQYFDRVISLARKNPNARVIGVDKSGVLTPSEIEEVKQSLKNKDIDFKLGDFTDPKLFKRHSIDVAEFNWSLFPEDRDKALSNLTRWLKKNGEVRVRMHTLGWINEKLTLKEFIDARKQVTDFFRKNGFRVIEGKQYLNYGRDSITEWESQILSKREGLNAGELAYPIIIARRGKTGLPIRKRWLSIKRRKR